MFGARLFVIYVINIFIALIPLVNYAGETHAVETKAAQGSLVIRGGWLFDGVSDTRRRNSGIMIRDGKIVSVDGDIAPQDLTGANIIDLAESETILPGLIDLHAHYNANFVDRGRAEEVVHNGVIFLANGVTSTWSAGEFFP